jgi:hypothetical protein
VRRRRFSSLNFGRRKSKSHSGEIDMMTLTNFNEELNTLINMALANVSNVVGSGQTALTFTTIASTLTTAGTNVTALGATFTHDRTIQDPGAALNPQLPGFA